MSLRGTPRVQTVQQLAVELWQEGRGPILIAVAGGWLLSLGVRMMYPAILPHLRATFDLTWTLAGMLITVLWVAYAIGQLPAGILDDAYGGARVLVWSTLISALGLTLVVGAPTTVLLFSATAIFGFATALYGISRFTILSTHYPDRSGIAIGLTMAAGDLGNSLLPPLAGIIAVQIAWQLGLGFTIPLFLLAAVGLYLSVPLQSQPTDNEQSDNTSFAETMQTVATALYNRQIVYVIGIQILGYIVWQAFTAFYPAYLIEIKGLDPSVATLIFGGFFAIGIVVKPLTGSAYDAYGIRRSLPIVLLLITVAMGVLPFVENLGSILIITALASSVLGYGAITLTHLTRALPDSVQGTGLGSIRASYMILGAGSPIVVGLFADIGLFDEAFFLLAGIAFLATVLSVRVPVQNREESLNSGL